MSADPHFIADRLEEAINDWKDGSIRRFHREIEPLCKERGIRGASYTALHRYLNGETAPSPEFLEAAAEVLGVRASWLAFGEGQQTPIEQQVYEEGEDDLPTVAALEAAREQLGPDHPVWAQATLRPWLQDTVRQLVVSCPDASEASVEQIRRIYGFLEELIWRPALTIIGLGEAPSRYYADYFMGMVIAIRKLIPERGEGRPLDELMASLETWEEQPGMGTGDVEEEE